MKIYRIYKKVGQTPLEALQQYRKSKKIPPTAKLTYAGRLDPMAEGLLLVLQGASQTQKEKYLALPKVYLAEILLGITTDTFDILGIPGSGALPSIAEEPLKKGKITLPIPAYSSVPLNGKPMFVHARAEKLKIADLPKREMEIKQVRQLGRKQLLAKQLLKNIISKIKTVKGDFRQKEILKAWHAVFPTQAGTHKPQKYQIFKLRLSVSSGTYIRSIANHLGGTLYSLKRISVGKYK